MFKILDGTPFAYILFCFKIELLKLEVMRMLSKQDSIQRDQLEMITLDQLVPANHLVRKIEASIQSLTYPLIIHFLTLYLGHFLMAFEVRPQWLR